MQTPKVYISSSQGEKIIKTEKFYTGFLYCYKSNTLYRVMKFRSERLSSEWRNLISLYCPKLNLDHVTVLEGRIL